MESGVETNNSVSLWISWYTAKTGMIQTATQEQRTAMEEMVKTVNDISETSQKVTSSSEECGQLWRIIGYGRKSSEKSQLLNRNINAHLKIIKDKENKMKKYLIAALIFIRFNLCGRNE